MDIKKQISERAKRATEDRVFPGCVVGIVRRSGERTILPFGNFTYDRDSNPVGKDTIYDVSSVTKSIPTASLLLTLVDKNFLALDDPVSKYVPEFGNYEGKRSVLVRHLLAYTLDLVVPSLASLKTKTADEILNIIVKAPLRHPPGTTHLYTNSTACIIGLVIRNVSGKNIDDLTDQEFFNPLGMNRSTFHPDKFPKDTIVPTEFDEWRGRIIQGEVHDESTYVLNDKFILGISGLFSTVPDLLNFLEMLLNKGTFKGKKYFSEEIINQMGTNQIPELNDSTGLGWELNQPRFMGKYCGPRTFGKTGFTGTLCVCDVEKEVAYVILSNRIFPKRPKDSTAINIFRADIGDIIFGIDYGEI